MQTSRTTTQLKKSIVALRAHIKMSTIKFAVGERRLKRTLKNSKTFSAEAGYELFELAERMQCVRLRPFEEAK